MSAHACGCYNCGRSFRCERTWHDHPVDCPHCGSADVDLVPGTAIEELRAELLERAELLDRQLRLFGFRKGG